MALDYNPLFGFKRNDNPNDYQQYVGQLFKIRESVGILETLENSGYKFKKGDFDRIFEIIKIKTCKVTINGKIDLQIKIWAKANDGRKIRIVGYEHNGVSIESKDDGVYFRSSKRPEKNLPNVQYFPIILLEAYNSYRTNLIGSYLTHPDAEENFQIIDVKIKANPGDMYGSIYYKLRGRLSNLQKEFLASEAREKVFEPLFNGVYKTALIAVEKPEDPQSRYGNTTLVEEGDINKYAYSDSIINIIFTKCDDGFSFELKNLSEHSLKVIWDEASYIDNSGLSTKIMHKGIKYSDKSTFQPATTVIKGAKIQDVVIPIDNVTFEDNGWKISPLFPQKLVRNLFGEVRLMLPIQIKNEVNEYVFVFKIYFDFIDPTLLKKEFLQKYSF
jgi:hypothetical protein